MLVHSRHKLHQSQSAPTLSVCGQLIPGLAFSWWPREAGVFSVTQGGAWLTLDGPHSGPGNELGDHVLQVGQTLVVRAGQRLVIETWGAESVHFAWTPTRQASHWLAVFQPLIGLGLTGRGRGATSWRGARSRLARVWGFC
jgi:hypothetical protein